MRNQVNSIYKQAERFAEITKKTIITGNIHRAKKFFNVAEQLFQSGNHDTKIAIMNSYVLSITKFMELKHCSISKLVPASLKEEYTKQIQLAKL
ncbi:DUF7674 family protein [Flavobacterium sp. MAHUQ-51]|uniref:DUF7674 family protein n=1 Tax=Flavobacterium sp. GCM10022190 TaxID=3252639 RepID=UPI00362465EA